MKKKIKDNLEMLNLRQRKDFAYRSKQNQTNNAEGSLSWGKH